MAVAERDLVTVEQISPAPWKCSREHFQQMGELGMFVGQHVMLFDGDIVAMPAMGTQHRTAVILASDLLRDLFDGGHFVSVQCPFDIGKATDPEPDIAVIAGQIRDYVTCGLTQAALIIEVSDTTLDFDRRTKAPLYAGAGIEDYWIVNLNSAQVEVHRQPLPPDQIFGLGYADVKTYRPGELIEPLARSGIQVLVDDLLP